MNFVYHINYLIEDKRNAVLYGLKLCKHVELIWYYHMEFVFFLMENLVKIRYFYEYFFKNVIMKTDLF